MLGSDQYFLKGSGARGIIHPQHSKIQEIV